MAAMPPRDQQPHRGKLWFGDNIEDEWFAIFLLFEISRNFPYLFIPAWDNDDEFLLLEAAFHLPCWIDSETNKSRVYPLCRYPNRPQETPPQP
ncbi:unnamed protein product [Linum trigynum]|uniref:Uncharacterized protein n=1 Tax=Linum trigynum TaxID=586398 RepID=A0AAV2CM35_9ROSI